MHPEASPPPPDALPAPTSTVRAGIDSTVSQEAPVEPPSIVLLVVVTVLSAAADLASKGWVKAALSGYDAKRQGVKTIEIIKGHLDFVYTLNPGGAWSFLRGLPDSLRRPFFLFVSAAAIVFIVSVYRRIDRSQKAMKWGLPLALGGAIGNLVDRIRYGSVIDFIDMYITRGGREMHWPTYNVADIAIVFGVGLMAIDTLFSPRQRPKKLDQAARDESEKTEQGAAGSVIEPSPPAV